MTAHAVLATETGAMGALVVLAPALELVMELVLAPALAVALTLASFEEDSHHDRLDRHDEPAVAPPLPQLHADLPSPRAARLTAVQPLHKPASPLLRWS